MPTCDFTKKNSFTHPPSCILPSFSQNVSRLLFPMRLWKFASTISFRKYKRKVVLLVIYLFNYDSSKSAFFIWHLTFSYKNILFFALCFGMYFLIKIYFSSWWNNILFWHVHQIHTFNNNLNDEEIIMFERKNNNRKKPGQNMLHNKTIRHIKIWNT